LSDDARHVMQVFPWPGNVRQLRHVLEQAVIRCDELVISAELMQQILRQANFPDMPGAEPVEAARSLATPIPFLPQFDHRPGPLRSGARRPSLAYATAPTV